MCVCLCRLYRRDPHQLFELLSMQLRSIATLYSNMYKSKLLKIASTTGIHDIEAEELINCK